jgi:hypothetical protein
MNDRKTPDDSEQFNEELNEDFDFGEASTETRPIQTTNAQGSNKKLLTRLLFVAIIVVGVIFYRFYSQAKHPPTVSQNAPTLQAENTVSPTIAAKPSNPELNLHDIEKAFSAADHSSVSPTPLASSIVTSTAPIVEGNIDELQKTLFAPEKVAKEQPIHKDISSKETEMLSQNLNTLNHQIGYILNQIKHLDSYTREVADNLNKLNDAINIMDNRLSAVTNTTSTLSKDVGNVRNEIGQFKSVLQEDGLDLSVGTASATTKEKSGIKQNKVAIEEPEYTVRAAIPGRAWLQSTKGQKIITVAEGDTVGNYGKILAIDAASGVVLTSSGVAFH